MLNYFETIHFYFPLFITVRLFQWKKNININLLNKLNKSSLVVKQKIPLILRNANVTQLIYQYHPRIILDTRLTFKNHLTMVTTKINETTGLLPKLQIILPRTL